MTKAEYQTYLASREWAEKRESVRRRSGGMCERCLIRPMDAVHHRTYERIGNEEVTDLMAICNPCHAFLSAKTNIDPRELWQVEVILLDRASALAHAVSFAYGTEWNFEPFYEAFMRASGQEEQLKREKEEV